MVKSSSVVLYDYKVLSEPVSFTADGNVQRAGGNSTCMCSEKSVSWSARLKLKTGMLGIEPDRWAQPCPEPPCVLKTAVVSTKPLSWKHSRQQ